MSSSQERASVQNRADVHLNPADAYLLVMGKGRKAQEVSLGQRAGLDLKRYVKQFRKDAAPADPVFLSQRGRALTRMRLDQFLYRLKASAGVAQAGAHTFRHSSATLDLEAGGEIYRLSHRLGHSSVKTTEHYIRGLSQRPARSGQSVLDKLL